MNDAPLIHNKTAVTQAAETQQVCPTIVRLLQGSVKPEEDVDSKISDSANNETATNRLKGVCISVPCVGHCAQNTAYHGSEPDEGKRAFVQCVCGQEWPPAGAEGGPISWVYCDLCGTSVHAECYALEELPDEFLCHRCRRQGFEVDDIVSFHWSNFCDRQYELIKAVLDGGYGKAGAGDFGIHLAEGGSNCLQLSRTVGERLFGVSLAPPSSCDSDSK